MREIEAKILDIDRVAVEKDVIALGAKKVFDGEIHAIYFDTPDKTLKRKKEVLRLRKVGDTTELVLKTSTDVKSVAKIKDENETTVGDFDATKKMLEHLCLTIFRRVRKERMSYKLGSVRFEFDTHRDNFSWIPPFLEIEAPTEDELFATAEKLGFGKDVLFDSGSDGLHKYYGKNPDDHNF